MSYNIAWNLRKIAATLYCNGLTPLRLQGYSIPFSLYASQSVLLMSRMKTTLVAHDSRHVGTFKKTFKKLGWLSVSRSKLKRSGYYLYESVADCLHYPLFFKEFNLEDTFFSWFLITELHVWMLLVRLMAENEEGRLVRNSLVEAMWEDVSTRVKKVDMVNTSYVNIQMTELSEQFNAAIVGYDEGLLSEDKVLAGALWRRFFQQKCSDPLLVECLVKYVRKQVMMLDQIPREKVLFSSSITWNSIELIDEVPG